MVAVAEIARMLRLSRQRVTQVTAKPGFPAPIARLGVGKIWAYEDVRAWAEATRRAVHPIGVSSRGPVVGER